MTFVIGDIHGCFDKLLKLYEKIPQGSAIYSVGDLVDRGDKSKEVVDFVIEKEIKAVMGNHDEMFYAIGESIAKDIPSYHISSWEKRNGGDATIKSFNLRGLSYEENSYYFNWAKNLPLYIKTDLFRNGLPVVISHAYIGDNWELRDSDSFKNIALWNRDTPSKDSKIYNIFGHTPTPEPIITQTYASILVRFMMIIKTEVLANLQLFV